MKRPAMPGASFVPFTRWSGIKLFLSGIILFLSGIFACTQGIMLFSFAGPDSVSSVFSFSVSSGDLYPFVFLFVLLARGLAVLAARKGPEPDGFFLFFSFFMPAPPASAPPTHQRAGRALRNPVARPRLRRVRAAGAHRGRSPQIVGRILWLYLWGLHW